ncbi:MAG: hypothetical protein J4432_01420 [DPANN group archaeon]|nr:hypothetical protein [DPANN group archaeon]
MRNGVVFTLDAILALGILLMTIGIVISFVSIQTQQNDNTIKLSRLARDIYEIDYYFTSGLIAANAPGDVVQLCNDDYQEIAVMQEVFRYNDVTSSGHDESGVFNKWHYAGISPVGVTKKACLRGVK